MEKVANLIARAVMAATVNNATAPSGPEKALKLDSPAKKIPQLAKGKISSLLVEKISVPNESESADGSTNTKPTSEFKKQPSLPSRDRNWRPRATSELMLVKSVLAKALARKGLEKKVERYAFILYWKEIVGESLAIICKPECLSRNTLVIRVLNSGWAQEISFMKPVLLQRLSAYLPPGDVVDDITFRVGPL